MVGIEVGSTAVDFTLSDSSLKPIQLSDYSGKYVVLCFFPMSFSGNANDGCELQLCSMNHLYTTECDPDVIKVFGVSLDGPFPNGAFESKLGLQFPLLSDPTGSTVETYVGKCEFGKFFKENKISNAIDGMITSNRGCVVINPEGKVVYSFSGNGHPGLQPNLNEIKSVLPLKK
uniref:Thioredoxin domain-containing protein n=1 Tax=Timspurckia oligopyrenoides TaxID=708627 RepID=A0A7S0ZJX5_9RHOD|mmetsp:Transcript_74/g.126  ORF Transcript_74/g.126 Transcript_74/m.126 type:complete len:174 (+) Transcript_74:108-629(+)